MTLKLAGLKTCSSIRSTSRNMKMSGELKKFLFLGLLRFWKRKLIAKVSRVKSQDRVWWGGQHSPMLDLGCLGIV